MPRSAPQHSHPCCSSRPERFQEPATASAVLADTRPGQGIGTAASASPLAGRIEETRTQLRCEACIAFLVSGRSGHHLRWIPP